MVLAGRTTSWRRARHGAAALLAVAALLTTGCGADDGGDGTSADATAIGGGADPVADSTNANLVTDVGPPRAGGRLVYGLSAESDGWNPTLSRWGPSGLQVARSVFDLLAVVDDQGRWQPELAESFEPSADHMRWTIGLRPGVTFHDGTPLDAEALAASLQYIKDSPLTGVTFSFVETIEVEGDDVVVTMNMPWATFPYAFSTQIGAVAEPGWLAENAASNPVGTGPFRFDSWVTNDSLTVLRNDSYWRDGHPLLDEVQFRVVTDELEREGGLASGDLDVIQTRQGAQLARLRADAEAGQIQLACGAGAESIESFVMLNLKTTPFDDPDARRAVALATDRQAVIDQLGGGEVELASSPYAPSSPWHTDAAFPAHDLAAASALVAEVEDRTGEPFTVRLLSASTPDATRQSQVIAEQWTQAGIDVEVATLEQSMLIRNVIFGDYQAVTWQQFDAPHPLADSIWWTPRASSEPPNVALNFARNDDPVLRDLLDEAQGEPDRAEQQRLYADAQRQINQALPYIWLFHTKQCVAAQTSVVDLVRWTTPDGATGMEIIGGSHPLWQVWLDR